MADARFAKPLDADLIAQLARRHEILITIEEAGPNGFGALVLQHMAGAGLLDQGLKVRTLHIPDRLIDHDKPEKQYALAGLDAANIVRTVISLLGRDSEAARA